MALVVKNLTVDAGDMTDAGLTSDSGRCPRGGHGSPLQYSCLENPMDRGAWQSRPWGCKDLDRPERLNNDRGVDLFCCWHVVPRQERFPLMRGPGSWPALVS